ncbi:RadC family protein [Bacteroidota bacterium]
MVSVFLFGVPDALKNPQGSGVIIMTYNLFTSNLAEIKITYSTKIKPSDRRTVTTSNDAYDVFLHIFPNIEYREYFYILLLNRSNKILGYNQISVGGISGTVVDVRLIFQTALKANASSIIIGHNHPSGNLNPSETDNNITNKIKQGGVFLDIPVIDHIILTPERYFSFADEGVL